MPYIFSLNNQISRFIFRFAHARTNSPSRKWAFITRGDLFLPHAAGHTKLRTFLVENPTGKNSGWLIGVL
jgi:hypothetical protein